MAEETIESIVFPQLLTESIFSEDGSSLFFADLFDTSNNSEGDNSVEQPLISNRLYNDHIVPFITLLFDSKHLTVRISLLKLFPKIYPSLISHDPTIALRWLMAEIFAGLNDREDDIYYGSLCAICLMVPEHNTTTLKQEKTGIRAPNTTFHIGSSALLNDYIIPCVLKMCTSSMPAAKYLWSVLDSVALLWKRISIDLASTRVLIYHAETRTARIMGIVKIASQMFFANSQSAARR